MAEICCKRKCAIVTECLPSTHNTLQHTVMHTNNYVIHYLISNYQMFLCLDMVVAVRVVAAITIKTRKASKWTWTAATSTWPTRPNLANTQPHLSLNTHPPTPFKYRRKLAWQAIEIATVLCPLSPVHCPLSIATPTPTGPKPFQLFRLNCLPRCCRKFMIRSRESFSALVSATNRKWNRIRNRN